MRSVLNVSNHSIDLDDGRTLAPGETAPDVDTDHPHNKVVLEQGLALALEDAEPSTASRRGNHS